MTAKNIVQSIFIKNNKKKMEMKFFIRRWAGPGKQAAHGCSRPAHARGERRASRPGSGFGPRPAWPRAVGRDRGHATPATLAAAARRLPTANGHFRSRAGGAWRAREPRREGEPVFGARETRGVAGSRFRGRPRAVAPWPSAAKTRGPHLLGSEGGNKVRTGCRRRGRSWVREEESNGGSPSANLAGGCGGGGARAVRRSCGRERRRAGVRKFGMGEWVRSAGGLEERGARWRGPPAARWRRRAAHAGHGARGVCAGACVSRRALASGHDARASGRARGRLDRAGFGRWAGSGAAAR
jgi:hypothetical protein